MTVRVTANAMRLSRLRPDAESPWGCVVAGKLTTATTR